MPASIIQTANSTFTLYNRIIDTCRIPFAVAIRYSLWLLLYSNFCMLLLYIVIEMTMKKFLKAR